MGIQIAFFDVETTDPTRPGRPTPFWNWEPSLYVLKNSRSSIATPVRPVDPLLISSLSVRCNGITLDAVVCAPSLADIADTVFDILHGRMWAGHNIVRFIVRE